MFALLLSLAVWVQASAAHQIVQGVSSGVAALAVSSDGYVATLHTDNSLRIWRLDTRTLLRLVPAAQVPEHVSPVRLAWDERTHEVLFASGQDGMFAVDLEGHTRAIPGDVEAVRVSPAGHLVASMSSWELHDGAGAKLGALAGRFADVALSADGKVGIGIDRGGVRSFALPGLGAGKLVALKPEATGSDGLQRNTIALSRSGTTAAVCLGAWDAKKQLAIIDHLTTAPTVKLVALNDEGCSVAVGEYGTAVVAEVSALVGVDLATGAIRWKQPLEFAVTATAIELAIRDRIALASIPDGRIRMFDVVRGEAIGDLGHMLAVPRNFWFAPADRVIATLVNPYRSILATTDDLGTWSLADGKLARSAGFEGTYQIAENGTLAVARSTPDFRAKETCYTFSVGTLADGAPVGATERDTWPPRPGHSVATCVPLSDQVHAIDPVTGTILLGKHPHEAIFTLGKPRTALVDPGAMSMPLEIATGGKFVLGANMYGSLATLWVWNAATGKKDGFTADPNDPPATITIGGPGPLRRGYAAAAVSPDGQQLVVGGGDSASVYRMIDHKLVRTVRLASGQLVSAVALGADGTVVLGTVQGSLAIAPPKGGTTTIASDGGAIQQIEIRGDGGRIVSRSDDGGLRVWNPRAGALAATFVAFADGEQLAMTPAGAYAGRPEAVERVSWVFDGPTEGFSFERYAAAFSHPEVVTKRLGGAADDLPTTVVRPPRIALLAPPPAKAKTATLAIRAHVEATAGKVTEVRGFVDGRPRIAKPIDAASADVDLEITVGTGVEVVTLVAFDDGGRASNPTSFEIDASGIAAPRPDLWIVAAGVGWYPQLDDKAQLAAPVPDAHAIAAAFGAQVGPGKTYAAAHVTILEDEQVTPPSVDTALRKLSAMKPNDVAIVFFAGHGVKPPGMTEMVFLTSTVKPDKTTWAQSGIGWSAIGSALTAARGRVLVLLDACHSGHVSTEVLAPNTELADSLVHAQRAGVLVFAASRGDQSSFEANAARGLDLDDDQQAQVGRRPAPAKTTKTAKPPPPPLVANTPNPTAPRERAGEGFFTGALVAALAAASTDTNRDGMVELSELVMQVEARVGRATHGKQTPWVVRRELFGDYPLVHAAR